MFLCIENPRDMTISRDNTLPWVHPSEVPARKHARNSKKQESKKFYKNLANQSPSLISQKCLKISEMSKKDETVDQSENCRLRMPENFCQEQGDATIATWTRISPPLALPTTCPPRGLHFPSHSTNQFPQRRNQHLQNHACYPTRLHSHLPAVL